MTNDGMPMTAIRSYDRYRAVEYAKKHNIEEVPAETVL